MLKQLMDLNIDTVDYLARILKVEHKIKVIHIKNEQFALLMRIGPKGTVNSWSKLFWKSTY